MVLQGQSISPSSWKKDSTAINGISVLIDQFLQEAVQILGQVDKALPIKQKNVPDTPQSESDNDNNTSKDSKNNTNDSDVGNNDNDDDAIVWQLNLTPSMMTLDTSILTVSDLEKVLELIRTNVSPRPSKPEDVSKSRLLNISSSYDIPYLRQIVASVLQLSAKCSIPIAEQQHAAQYNTVQLMRHCVQSFIDCSYSFFLDLPSLVADTEMILSQPGAAREHTVETLLILSICTIMIRHTTLHHRGDMSVANILMFSYYTQAHHLLQDLFDVQHISVLQSMYLLSIFHEEHTQLFSPTKFPSTLLNMAIRMALAMDLHKLDIQNSKESDQKEKLRRLAWMLLCADYYAQWNVSGHTGFIDVSQWHVNFPQPLPNETFARRVEFFSQYCRVITIRKMDLFKSAYLYTLHSFAQTLDDDNKSNLHLFETFFNTPDTFKLNLDNLNQAWNNKSYLEPLLLHELYCHTQLFAQLPFLPKRYFDIFSRKEDKASINDLKDICRQLNLRIPFSTSSPDPDSSDSSRLTDFINTRPSQYLNCSLSSSLPPTEHSAEVEFRCLIDILNVTNDYTLILEALALVDNMGCFHSPVYGMLVTAYTYLIIDTANVDLPEIKTLCHINLLRTQRILQQARSIYNNPVIFYIERLLVRHQEQQQQQEQQQEQQQQNFIKIESDIEQAPIDTLHRRAHDIIHSIRINKSRILEQWQKQQMQRRK